MYKRKYPYFILIVLGAALFLASMIFLWPAARASAQCGSQASSCKNCHETQAQKPVNNDGTAWHTQHQQIDACVSCHAGNPQSMNIDESHAGMVSWNSDVKAGCYTCHPNDYMDKARVYATTLGVQLGGSGASTGDAQPTSPPSTPAATSIAAPAVVVSEPGVIDYARQYDETVLGKHPINWGNVIVVITILGIAAGGGAFVYWNERRLRGLPLMQRSQGFKPKALATQVPVMDGYSPEVAALLPMIACLNPVGLHALKRILQKPEQANDMLHALSHLDPELVRRIQALDKDSRSLLIALAGS